MIYYLLKPVLHVDYIFIQLKITNQTISKQTHTEQNSTTDFDIKIILHRNQTIWYFV